MSTRKSICLNMIVKNEAHIIADTLENLLRYVRFDYWVISDTGSTDQTKEIIIDFFKQRNIDGELVEHAWQDFGFNRTKAFEAAYNKTDYVFVWDADDEIFGDFEMPTELVADSYSFIFGNESGLRYSRNQMFNNRKRWSYKGVLHEYACCLEPSEPSETISGSYYFISGRKGSRNKDPKKYLNDALLLEKAIEKAKSENDPIFNRYTFYCAQSYNSCDVVHKAIEYYKKALNCDLWAQEKYICCLELYELHEKLNRAEEGLHYLVESYKYDKTRVECFYRLIKYYCIHNAPEVAFAYYSLIQDYYENQYSPTLMSDKLFVKIDEYNFYLPYYMIIVSERTKHLDVAGRMYEIIFKYKFIAKEWWTHNLLANMRFCVAGFKKTSEFLNNMLHYVDLITANGVKLESKHTKAISTVIDSFREVLSKPLNKSDISIKVRRSMLADSHPTVMLTITTCKRFDLFTKTINSIFNCWTDVDKIDYFYCVDDNSSSEDREAMQKQYPFFNYYMKSSAERGHRESMNIIWSELNKLKPTYWVHLEDDWMFFRKEAYVTRAVKALETYESSGIHQVVFNRNYGLMFSDLDIVGGISLDADTILHEKREGLVGKNCGYWPHYSLQPSLVRTRIALQLGNYDSPNQFFERDYADRYFASGYKTAFFNSIYSIHIGKQLFETDGKNAYELNAISQFNR